jgi:hypothetical protein
MHGNDRLLSLNFKDQDLTIGKMKHELEKSSGVIATKQH